MNFQDNVRLINDLYSEGIINKTEHTVLINNNNKLAGSTPVSFKKIRLDTKRLVPYFRSYIKQYYIGHGTGYFEITQIKYNPKTDEAEIYYDYEQPLYISIDSDIQRSIRSIVAGFIHQFDDRLFDIEYKHNS